MKGRLGSLVKLSKENHDKATALETAAGARLWNVIVDDENVGKTLLGLRLQKRVTLIPLNKIEGRRLDQRVTCLSYPFLHSILMQEYSLMISLLRDQRVNI